WSSHIYAFYNGDVSIEYRENKLHHVFTCAARGCGHKVSRNQTSKDRNSTKNLRKHAVKCWGEDTVNAASDIGGLEQARALLKRHKGERNQRLTDIFKSHSTAGHGDTLSHVPLTRAQTRIGFVRWISESLRPFRIAVDRGFHYLMKSGRPNLWTPSPSTIAGDVKVLYKKTRERISIRLRKRDGCVSLATDAWTSPNHRAFVAVSGHWKRTDSA
ncbi:hypothetical protein B0H17DRAFT_943027, partial [Mycena rosella]